MVETTVPKGLGGLLETPVWRPRTRSAISGSLHSSRGHFQPSTSLVADGKVTFRWRDSAHSNEQKLMTLSVDEFLRRFLLHLLPEGFVRIRNFGFLANRKRATTLPLCFQRLGGAPRTEPEASTAGPSDLWSCPKCGGPMMVVERLTASEIQLRSPPLVTAAA